MPEISQQDLDLFERYKQLGEPDTLETSLAEKNQLERSTTLSAVANNKGYKVSVLEKLTEGLELTVDGENVMISGTPIEDYAQQNWGDFMPALQGAEVGDKKKIGFVAQPTKPAPQNPIKNVAKDYIKRTYAQPKAAA